MKTIRFLSLVGLLFSLHCRAQYFQRLYPHDSTLLSSVHITTATAGFVIGGYRYHNQNGSNRPDFVIDQVNQAGLFTGGFSNDYFINDDLTSCFSGIRVHNCQGVSVIETVDFGNGNGEAYALAGTYKQGLFFATLNANGNIIGQYRWDFPATNLNPRAKPVLFESSQTPGTFYIAGEFNGETYVVQIDATTNPFTPGWANFYNGSVSLEAWDMIESPYNSGHLVIVGRTDRPNSGEGADGFFLRLNTNNGSVSTHTIYHNVFDSDEWLSDIKPARSGSGGSDGYIVGGRSIFYDQPPCGGCTRVANDTYPYWMAKISRDGGIVWSSLIEPSYAATLVQPDDITDVVERNNPNSGGYEYYGVGHSAYYPSTGTVVAGSHLVVFKLDDNGQDSHSPDEFHYKLGTAPHTYMSEAQITAIQTGTGAVGDGIQVFGTRMGSQTSHYFVRAYFNGVSGCNEEHADISMIAGGPGTIYTDQINITPWNVSCNPLASVFFISVNSLMPNQSPSCFSSTLGSGSNARGITGIENTERDNNLMILPNPTTGQVKLRFEQHLDGVKINVRNALGQVVATDVLHPGGDESFEVNLSNYDLPDGMYHIHVDSGTYSAVAKIILSK